MGGESNACMLYTGYSYVGIYKSNHLRSYLTLCISSMQIRVCISIFKPRTNEKRGVCYCGFVLAVIVGFSLFKRGLHMHCIHTRTRRRSQTVFRCHTTVFDISYRLSDRYVLVKNLHLDPVTLGL